MPTRPNAQTWIKLAWDLCPMHVEHGFDRTCLDCEPIRRALDSAYERGWNDGHAYED